MLQKDTLDSNFLNYVCVEYPGYKRNVNFENELEYSLDNINHVDYDIGYQEPGNRQSGRLVSFRVRNAKVAAKLVTVVRKLLKQHFPQHHLRSFGDTQGLNDTFVGAWKLDPQYYGTNGQQLNDYIRSLAKSNVRQEVQAA